MINIYNINLCVFYFNMQQMKHQRVLNAGHRQATQHNLDI
jgi:hypothetical protein